MSTTEVRTRPRPGAVLGLGRSELRPRLRRAFAEAWEPPIELTDGPLTLTFAAGPFREIHTGGRIICLLDGALHDGARDAGALAAAYEAEGEAMLPSLRGEFWALIWDRRRARGIVVCDQLGTRSPYWTVEDGVLLCAGDIPELLAARRRHPEPDPVALAHWLMVNAPPAGATLFAGVRRLEAGHLLELVPGRPLTRRYFWPRYRPALPAPRVEVVSRVREALELAVGRRVTSGTGVLLSGGLDSGAVAALARRQKPDLRAYSAVFPHHPDVDESALIDLSGLPGARVVVEQAGVLAGALEYLQTWGVPPTSPNMFFWTPLFARAATDGVAVMLDGEGGDEVFGFSPYLLADCLRHGQIARALRLAARWPGRGGQASRKVLLRRLREYGLAAALPPVAHLASRRLRGLRAYAPPWFDTRLAREWLDSSDAAFAWKRLDGPRWWAFLADAITRGSGPAAAYEQARRRAATAGLESRHPLVDLDLIELLLAIDPELAFDPQHGRPLLREALAGALPDAVRLRAHKSYFDQVFHDGLARVDVPLARRLLEPGRAELSAYVDLRALNRQLFDPAAAGSEAWALTLWRCLTAECWLRQQADPEVCRRLCVEAVRARTSIEPCAVGA